MGVMLDGAVLLPEQVERAERPSKRQRVAGAGAAAASEREWAAAGHDGSAVAAPAGLVRPLPRRVEPCAVGRGCCGRAALKGCRCTLEALSFPASDVPCQAMMQDSAVPKSRVQKPSVSQSPADNTEASCVLAAAPAAAVVPSEAWPPPPVRGRTAMRVTGRRAHRSRHRLTAASSDAAAVDYARALRFIARVKSTCAPECFPAFLETLLAYHRGKISVVQVYEKASALFSAQDSGVEVLQAFREFLPDALQGVSAN